LTSPLLAQAPCYRAIVLPPSIENAQDVNNDGAVPVGIVEEEERAPGIWTEGELHEVCGPEVSGVAIAINANEAVTVVQRRTAIVCETGAAYSLQLPMPGDEPKPADMNDHGTVVGHVNSDDFVRAAAWTDGAVHLLPTLGGWHSVADGINNLGEIVGNATTTADDQLPCVFTPDEARTLSLNGLEALRGWARALNDAGQIVGAYIDVQHRSNPVMWEDGLPRPLPMFAHADESTRYNYDPRDINAVGDIVGLGQVDGEVRAALWTTGAIFDLNVITEPIPNMRLEVAQGINDWGWIVVSATETLPGTGTQRPRAVLLVPSIDTCDCRPRLPTWWFRRGDANDDASLDISDAVFVLSFLFLGTETPTCMDAADANDDGAVDVSDPVGVLAFMFSGGFPPPSPRVRCDEDPSSDALSCESYTSCTECDS